MTVDEVAATHHIHRTVAFEHLELLAGVGLVVRGSRRGHRGRPARTYRFGGAAAEVSHPLRQHRTLAILLAGALAARGRAGRDHAKRAGVAYGRALAAGSRSKAEAMAGLEVLGARYETAHDHIHARNCVFREACLLEHEVVCSLQAGILEGALGVAGGERDVAADGPDGSGGCTFRIED
jgi:predicted ArsR family transcriptional regulator